MTLTNSFALVYSNVVIFSIEARQLGNSNQLSTKVNTLSDWREIKTLF